MAELEAAALDGRLFQDRHRSPSPSRSMSTTSNDSEEDQDEDVGRDLPERGDGFAAGVAGAGGGGGGGGGGGAQTGPKGVLSDRKSYNASQKAQRKQALRDLKSRQEKEALIGLTNVEEEAARERERLIKDQQGGDEEDEARERYRRQRIRELQQQKEGFEGYPDNEENAGRIGDPGRGVKRGGLREVGAEGFLTAVERPGWVVVLIYEPGIPRCSALLASTLSLSLSLPSNLPTPVTLLRARATSLSFSLLPGHPDDAPKADPDVLPTILAYRDGELEKTWIRVDWEVGEDGVEGLLRRTGILPDPNRPVFGEKDLLGDSDEDEER